MSLRLSCAWAFDYIQKRRRREASERNWLRDETGGSVYLRLSTRPIEQIAREMTPELRQDIVDGAYWLRKPGPNCASRRRLYGRDRAGSDRSRRPDGGGSARCRPARHHLGRPAECRLDRRATRARARPRACALAISSACSPTCPRIAASSPCSTDIRRRSPGSARCTVIACARSASSISARPDRSPDLYRHYGIDANAIVAPRRRSRPAGPIRHLKALP